MKIIKQWIPFVFCLSLLDGCGPSLITKALPNGNMSVKGGSFEGVIFTPENASKTIVLYQWDFKSDKGKFWTPDAETIKRIERQMKRALGTVPRSKSPKEYRRQYFGVRDYGQDDLVLINIFCDDFGAKNWTNESVMVADGGACYIRLLYSKSLNYLKVYQVNGYA